MFLTFIACHARALEATHPNTASTTHTKVPDQHAQRQASERRLMQKISGRKECPEKLQQHNRTANFLQKALRPQLAKPMQPNSQVIRQTRSTLWCTTDQHIACPAIAFTITAGCSSRYLTTLVIGFSLLEGKGKISI